MVKSSGIPNIGHLIFVAWNCRIGDTFVKKMEYNLKNEGFTANLKSLISALIFSKQFSLGEIQVLRDKNRHEQKTVPYQDLKYGLT